MAILIGAIPVLVCGAHQDGIFGVGFDVFLQILRTFEGLSTKLTSMRFQWDMDPNMRCDMISFDDLDLTVSPGTHQVQIVGTLATDMSFANVILP